MPHHTTDRRKMLLVAGSAALALALTRRNSSRPPEPAAPAPPAPTGTPPRSLDEPSRRALEALQRLILPSVDGSPSAADVHAADYVEAVLSRRELDQRRVDLLVAGLASLQSPPAFASLDHTAQVRAIEALYAQSDDARAFYDIALALTLEAWLGDPAHGGNPGGITWSWLGIDPPGTPPTR